MFIFKTDVAEFIFGNFYITATIYKDGPPSHVYVKVYKTDGVDITFTVIETCFGDYRENRFDSKEYLAILNTVARMEE